MKQSAGELLELIKKYLRESGSSIEGIEALDIDTDLVSFGIESIVILQLLAFIEDECNLALSLSNLENCNFVISAQTISNDFSRNGP